MEVIYNSIYHNEYISLRVCFGLWDNVGMFIVERLLSVLAPHQCMVCGDEGSVVCDWCLPDFALPLPSRCYACKVATPDSQVCKKCRRTSKLKHVWVRAEYETKV